MRLLVLNFVCGVGGAREAKGEGEGVFASGACAKAPKANLSQGYVHDCGYKSCSVTNSCLIFESGIP